LTELAVEGFGLLADELRSVAGDLLAVALDCIRFTRRCPGHFDIMFRGDLLRSGDERLAAMRDCVGAELRSGVAQLGVAPDAQHATELAAWSLVHGFASLWQEGAPADPGLDEDDPESLARRVVATIEFVGETKH
jgi:hypothetical protein